MAYKTYEEWKAANPDYMSAENVAARLKKYHSNALQSMDRIEKRRRENEAKAKKPEFSDFSFSSDDSDEGMFSELMLGGSAGEQKPAVGAQSPFVANAQNQYTPQNTQRFIDYANRPEKVSTPAEALRQGVDGIGNLPSVATVKGDLRPARNSFAGQGRGASSSKADDTLAYTMANIGAGAASSVNNIGAGIELAVWDAATKGEGSGKINRIESAIGNNTRLLEEISLPGPQGVGARRTVAEAAGVTVEDVERYARISRQDRLDSIAEDTGENLSDSAKKGIKGVAYNVGAMLPGLFMGNAGAGVVDDAAKAAAPAAKSVINAIKAKTPAGAAVRRRLLEALKGNITTRIMGASAAGSSLLNSVRERGFDTRNYTSAIADGFSEHFIEGLFGIRGTESLMRIAESKGLGGIVDVAISGVGEGVEEAAVIPFSRGLKRIFGEEYKLFGDGGIIDLQEMVRNGWEGMKVGWIMAGSVNVVNAVSSDASAKEKAEALNAEIENEGGGISPLDPETATEEQVNEKAAEILARLSQISRGIDPATGQQFANGAEQARARAQENARLSIMQEYYRDPAAWVDNNYIGPDVGAADPEAVAEDVAQFAGERAYNNAVRANMPENYVGPERPEVTNRRERIRSIELNINPDTGARYEDQSQRVYDHAFETAMLEYEIDPEAWQESHPYGVSGAGAARPESAAWLYASQMQSNFDQRNAPPDTTDRDRIEAQRARVRSIIARVNPDTGERYTNMHDRVADFEREMLMLDYARDPEAWDGENANKWADLFAQDTANAYEAQYGPAEAPQVPQEIQEQHNRLDVIRRGIDPDTRRRFRDPAEQIRKYYTEEALLHYYADPNGFIEANSEFALGSNDPMTIATGIGDMVANQYVFGLADIEIPATTAIESRLFRQWPEQPSFRAWLAQNYPQYTGENLQDAPWRRDTSRPPRRPPYRFRDYSAENPLPDDLKRPEGDSRDLQSIIDSIPVRNFAEEAGSGTNFGELNLGQTAEQTEAQTAEQAPVQEPVQAAAPVQETVNVDTESDNDVRKGARDYARIKQEVMTKYGMETADALTAYADGRTNEIPEGITPAQANIYRNARMQFLENQRRVNARANARLADAVEKLQQFQGKDIGNVSGEFYDPVRVADVVTGKTGGTFLHDLARRIQVANAVRANPDAEISAQASPNVRRAANLFKEATQAADALNLTKAESKALELFGEGRDVDWSKVDRAKVEAALPVVRKYYDAALNMLNTVRAEYGLEPIPRRNNYFTHMKNISVASMMASDGFFIDPFSRNGTGGIDSAMVDVLRAQEPGFAKARTQDANKNPDAIGGLKAYMNMAERYVSALEAVSDVNGFLQAAALAGRANGENTIADANARSVEAIMNDPNLSETERRVQLAQVAATTQIPNMPHFTEWLVEWRNILAGGSTKLDAARTKLTRSVPGRILNTLQRNVGTALVRINPGSMLMNLIPTVTLSKDVPAKYRAQALAKTVSSKANNDGLMSGSAFYQNRKGMDWTAEAAEGDVASGNSFSLGAITDVFTAEFVVRARYYQNIDNGMTHTDALAEADQYAGRLIGERVRGLRSLRFENRNPLSRAVNTFQLEPVNQIISFTHDITSMHSGANVLRAYIVLLINSALAGELFEELRGEDPMLNPIGDINDYIGAVTGTKLNNLFDIMRGKGLTQAVDTEDGRALKGAASDTLEDVPFANLLNLFLGLDKDMGGLPIQEALPSPEEWKNAATAWGEAARGEATPGYALRQTYRNLGDMLNLAPYGDIARQALRTGQGIDAVANGGLYTENADGSERLAYEVEQTPWNYVKGALFGRGAVGGTASYEGEMMERTSEGLAEEAARGIPRIVEWPAIDAEGKKVYDENGNAVMDSLTMSKAERNRAMENFSAMIDGIDIREVEPDVRDEAVELMQELAIASVLWPKGKNEYLLGDDAVNLWNMMQAGADPFDVIALKQQTEDMKQEDKRSAIFNSGLSEAEKKRFDELYVGDVQDTPDYSSEENFAWSMLTDKEQGDRLATADLDIDAETFRKYVDAANSAGRYNADGTKDDKQAVVARYISNLKVSPEAKARIAQEVGGYDWDFTDENTLAYSMLNDAQKENCDLAEKYISGMTPAKYKQVYEDTYVKGDDTKDKRIARIQKLGYSYNKALTLWKIIKGTIKE